MGLISSTALGAEVLDDYGWEATTSPLGMPTGLAIPINVQEFVSVREPVDVSIHDHRFFKLSF